MFTRTMGRTQGRRLPLLRRMVREQLSPVRPLMPAPHSDFIVRPGSEVDGVTIWPAEACTDQGSDDNRISVRALAAHFFGGLAFFAMTAYAAADQLLTAIRMLG